MLTCFPYSIIPGFQKALLCSCIMHFQVIQSSQITFSISFFKYVCILCRTYTCLLHQKACPKHFEALAGEKPAYATGDDGTYRGMSYEIFENYFSSVVTRGYNAKWQQNDNARQDMVPLQLIYCK